MRKLLQSLFILVLLLSSCASVEIPHAVACHVAGVLSAGANCADTHNGAITMIDLDQILDMLEAQPERPDPRNPGKVLPAHGAAVIISSEDWNGQKTALEEACRILGKRCTYQMVQQIAFMSRVLQ